MKIRKITAVLLSSLVVTLGLTSCGSTSKSETPTSVIVWHYYNGAQQQIFDELVQEFNETVGAEQKIVVDSQNQGTISELTDKVLKAIHGEIGADEVPDVFAAYADTAYEIDQLDMAADLSSYLSQEEMDQYVASYLEEGRFSDDGDLKIFPVAKSTELLMLNNTAWQEFSSAVGIDTTLLSTWEGNARASEEYYKWTDAQTPDVPDDGKVFFGRDAFANYIIIGSKQLGTELFQVSGGKVNLQVNAEVMRKLWDNFYVPYINGYYGAYGRFRSDDMKTGDLVAMVCASSGATYFPTEVTSSDGTSYPIEGSVYPLPNFEGTDNAMAVQQGAGMVVTKSDEAREKAAVTFLKWFTAPEQNVRFAMSSGYLPVTYEGNSQSAIDQAISDSEQPVSDIVRSSLDIGVSMTQNYTFYTSKAFKNGFDARNIVEHSMMDQANADLEQIRNLMSQGTSRADAVAQYNTDENFQNWLNSFETAINQAINK